ncbi:MAG: hypothetical protein QME94_19745, partial [Anaerolineae bacterium]|nr:hypothetical protein [Anaerolineae bacterium]
LPSWTYRAGTWTFAQGSRLVGYAEALLRFGYLLAESPAPGTYSFPRTPAQLQALAYDPASRQIRPEERTTILRLEARGQVPGPVVRDPSGAADYIDAKGQLWDIKTFRSGFPLTKGGYTLEDSMSKIMKSLNRGENVALNLDYMSPDDVLELTGEIIRRGLSGRVRW